MTDWSRALMFADSQHRAGVLVAALQDTPDPAEKAKLLADNFNICDALLPWREELREEMEQSDFFIDGEPFEYTVPKFPRYVYRGAWEDDEAELALSWTTSKKRAEWFASYLTGMRAAFLGIRRREGVSPVVFRARCHEAYGYLNGRGEQEVVAKRLTAVTPILKAVLA